MTDSEIQVLQKIAQAADRFETWLHKNAGDNDDWPVRLRCAEDGAEGLTEHLNELCIALEPYRESRIP